jgi:hypothetical protein
MCLWPFHVATERFGYCTCRLRADLATTGHRLCSLMKDEALGHFKQLLRGPIRSMTAHLGVPAAALLEGIAAHHVLLKVRPAVDIELLNVVAHLQRANNRRAARMFTSGSQASGP